MHPQTRGNLNQTARSVGKAKGATLNISDFSLTKGFLVITLSLSPPSNSPFPSSPWINCWNINTQCSDYLKSLFSKYKIWDKTARIDYEAIKALTNTHYHMFMLLPCEDITLKLFKKTCELPYIELFGSWFLKVKFFIVGKFLKFLSTFIT